MTPFRYILAFAILALLLFLLADGILILIEKRSVSNPARAIQKGAITEPTSPDASGTRIREAVFDPRLIRYTGDGFLPQSVTISMQDPMQCLITIRNETSQPMRVGVNPHSQKGDPGSDYGLIAPREEVILDPRYPGRSSIQMHDHALPAHELTVVYGSGCK